MLRSDSIKDIAAALSKAQGEIQHAAKDSTNPHFNSKYADLASVLDACREPLAKNQLSFTQLPCKMESFWVLITRLMHSSGEFMESHCPIITSKQDAQGFGSGLTYARRYALASMVGVAQDDDDANAATKKQNQNNGGNKNNNAKPEGKPEAKPQQQQQKPKEDPPKKAAPPKFDFSTIDLDAPLSALHKMEISKFVFPGKPNADSPAGKKFGDVPVEQVISYRNKLKAHYANSVPEDVPPAVKEVVRLIEAFYRELIVD